MEPGYPGQSDGGNLEFLLERDEYVRIMVSESTHIAKMVEKEVGFVNTKIKI